MAKRSTSKTEAQAKRTPESAPARYRARVYHEIETDLGVKRVEPGMIVAVEGDDINIYPPEAFDGEDIAEQGE